MTRVPVQPDTTLNTFLFQSLKLYDGKLVPGLNAGPNETSSLLACRLVFVFEFCDSCTRFRYSTYTSLSPSNFGRTLQCVPEPWPFRQRIRPTSAAYNRGHIAGYSAARRIWPDVIVIAEGFDDHLVGERALAPAFRWIFTVPRRSKSQLKRSLWLSGYRWITENVGTEGRAIKTGVFIANRQFQSLSTMIIRVLTDSRTKVLST